MRVLWEIFILAVTNVVAISIWGSRLESRVTQLHKDMRLVKQALGYENGHHAAVFMRRDECKLLRKLETKVEEDE